MCGKTVQQISINILVTWFTRFENVNIENIIAHLTHPCAALTCSCWCLLVAYMDTLCSQVLPTHTHTGGDRSPGASIQYKWACVQSEIRLSLLCAETRPSILILYRDDYHWLCVCLSICICIMMVVNVKAGGNMKVHWMDFANFQPLSLLHAHQFPYKPLHNTAMKVKRKFRVKRIERNTSKRNNW